MLRSSVLFLLFIGFCDAQERSSPRQVVIGGRIDASTIKESDPLTLLASSTQLKSAVHRRPGYKELLTRSLCSQTEPLGPDMVIACAACLVGACMTHTTFPQTSLFCNLTANCLASCMLLCYWIQDTPQEFTTGMLGKKTKSDVLHYLCCGAKKNE